MILPQFEMESYIIITIVILIIVILNKNYDNNNNNNIYIIYIYIYIYLDMGDNLRSASGPENIAMAAEVFWKVRGPAVQNDSPPAR